MTQANVTQVHVRKVKLLKAPKFDLGALLNLHGESNTDESGQKVCSTPAYQTTTLCPILTRHRLSVSSRRPSWRLCKRNARMIGMRFWRRAAFGTWKVIGV